MIPARRGLAKRLLVCGDRKWVNLAILQRTLVLVEGTFGPIETIIEGEAEGADKMAARVATQLGWPVLAFPADWSKLGKAAGPVRNKQMLDEGRPTMCIAFHADIAKSKGTRDMVSQAQRRGVPGFVVDGFGRRCVWMVDGKL